MELGVSPPSGSSGEEVPMDATTVVAVCEILSVVLLIIDLLLRQ